VRVEPGGVSATEDLPAVAADPGLVLGRYRLGARIGEGGFGTVYAAHDERLLRDVAVKVIPAGGPAPERAEREARAVARLDHPAIVRLFDAGEEDGRLLLVSELVEGRTLAQLQADGDLSDRDVLRAGLALADALGHAHERGVVHRDVKPQNVIVPAPTRGRRGTAKLTDFGVAQLAGDDPLTLTGDVVGTLAYMAPEQAEGNEVDEQCDLYALGIVLYEGLSGVHPVRANSPSATARRIGMVIPPLAEHRPDLPPVLTDAVDRAVRPDPDERGTLDDLFDALAEALPDVADDPGGAIAPDPLERSLPTLRPAVGRLVAPAAAGVLVALALIGLTPHPPVAPVPAAVAAALLVVLLPRAGWVAAGIVTAVVLAFGPDPRPGATVVVLAVIALPPLLLPADGRSWSLPAAAPTLGLFGVAGLYPVFAARAPWLGARAALGALGAWWLLLGEALLERVLVFGPAEGTPARAHYDGALSVAANDVVGRALTSGALLLAVVWAAGAAALPWLVRGRSVAADAVGAVLWSGGLALATVALGAWLGRRVPAPEPRGVWVGAVLAGGLAVLLAHARPPDPVEDDADEP
jgi:eukaryotic-like serine/threonine-protein kinase